jgi:hypothetical protein
MTTINQLLKSRTIVFAIMLAILPLFAQYIGSFTLTPIQQMIALQVIVDIVLLQLNQSPKNDRR